MLWEGSGLPPGPGVPFGEQGCVSRVPLLTNLQVPDTPAGLPSLSVTRCLSSGFCSFRLFCYLI